MRGDNELILIHKQRAESIGKIIIACFLIIIIRLVYLQLYKGEQYLKFSQQNRLRKEIIRSPRGVIYDRYQKKLVENTPRFDAILTRQYLKNKTKTLGLVSKIINVDTKKINKIIKKYSTQAKYLPIILKKNISRQEIARIEAENENLPGISVQTFISRDYIQKEVGAHLLGYISEISDHQLPKYKKRDGVDYKLGDFIGQFGLEEKWDKSLRGENGFEYVEVDALGRKRRYVDSDKLFDQISNKNAQVGRHLRLTIDKELQQIAFDALGDQSGSVTAIDVRTGEILAMVSTPSFNPSNFSRGLTQKYWDSLINNKENPLRDRSIQEHFPPGSTFKAFTAIAALEEKIISPHTKLQCHGMMKFGTRSYRSWQSVDIGDVNVSDALMRSCNIFFYKIGTQIDINTLARYAKLFGLGEKTGINLSREVSGLVPTKEWKLKKNGQVWQKGETLSSTIGQSYVLTSTLQLATAYAAIANKGTLLKPYVVKDILDEDGKIVESIEPTIIREIKLKKSTWDSVHKGLYKVMNSPEGTAFYKRGLGNQMAGKTGTSQVIRAKSVKALYSKCSDMPYKYRHHGVFAGFAPYNDPHIAVVALVEHGCGGSSAAAPVVEKIVSHYMQKNLPQQYEKNKKIELRQLKRIALQKKALESE